MAYEIKGDLVVTGDGAVDGSSTSTGSGSVPTPFVTAKAFGSSVDNFKTTLAGTGTTLPSVDTDGVSMIVGGSGKIPGRIYCEGRKFMTSGNEIFMLGANCPYFVWNDFGSSSFSISLWEENFQKLVVMGANSVRVWFNCDPSNEGITLNSEGVANAPTNKFWADCDAFFALAEQYQIYVMATMLSFDHFLWGNTGSLKYHLMIGSAATAQAYVDNVIVPFALRYKDNVYLWSIDLCNEPDNTFENMDMCTPKEGTCRPVGGGSQYVDFDYRVDDFVTDRQLWINGVDMGLVTQRVSDTRVKCTNSFAGASVAYSAGDYGWNNMSERIFPRYAAIAAKAIHRSGSSVLVTMGMASLKWASPTADDETDDILTDALLSGYTGDAASYLDFHSPHFYAWAEPWFTTFVTPTSAGLSAKPAVCGEIAVNPGDCNLPNVYETYVHGSFNYSSSGFVSRRKNPRTLKWEYYRHTGNGYSGWYPYPLSDEVGGAAAVGDTVVDNGLTLTRTDEGLGTWKPDTFYGWGQCVLADGWHTDGRCYIYRNTQAGTSSSLNTWLSGLNNGQGLGPMGTTASSYSSWAPLSSVALNTIISNKNFVWKCTQAGTTGNSGGPYLMSNEAGADWNPSLANGQVFSTDGNVIWTCQGWAKTWVDGTCRWELKRSPWETYDDILAFFRDNGWSGVLPWTSNAAGRYLGSMYFCRYTYGNYGGATAWVAGKTYYFGEGVISDSNKLYRMTKEGSGVSGQSAPTGTGHSITDGGCIWAYADTTDADLLTKSGTAMKAFSSTYSAKIFPPLGAGEDLYEGSVVRQSPHPTIYVPGVDIQSTLTFRFSGGISGLTQSVGWFDDDDGIFLSRIGTVDNLVVRRKGVDTLIPRVSWNVDPLNGSGISTLNIDLAAVNMLHISAGWLHGNLNRVGFMLEGQTYWAHEFATCNVTAPVVPSNPNLPLRWEISCQGDFENIASMDSFIGFASRNPVSLSVTSCAVSGQIWKNASITGGVAGLRLSAAGEKNALVRPTRIFIQDNSGEDETQNWWQVFKWWLVVNPTYWYSPVWSASTTYAETSVASLDATPSSGRILAMGYVHRNQFDMRLQNMPWLTAGDEVVLYVTNLSNKTRGYYGGIEWEERT